MASAVEQQHAPISAESFAVFIPEDPFDSSLQRTGHYREMSSSDSEGVSTTNESTPLHTAVEMGAATEKLVKEQRPPLSLQATTPIDGVYLRYMIKTDRMAVKELCRRLFPLEYPDYWYDEITHNDKLFALAAVVTTPSIASQTSHPQTELVIGLLVAETKCLGDVHKEDVDILDRRKFNSSTLVSYILSLGVLRSYRNKGIASRMLDEYLHAAVMSPPKLVKAIYLHVLHTNLSALNFYERREFRIHCKLRDYYRIDGELDDAYTCVLYTNGGAVRWTFSHGVTDLLVFLCQPVRKVLRSCLFGAQYCIAQLGR